VLQPPEGALFAEPRLFRACVPPGMHRFRGNYWESESLPIVRQKLGYPLPEGDTNPDEAAARRTELELGLQVSTSNVFRKCYIMQVCFPHIRVILKLNGTFCWKLVPEYFPVVVLHTILISSFRLWCILGGNV
jgi:hypothetical protein